MPEPEPLIAAYRDHLAREGLKHDAAQEALVRRLQGWAEKLSAERPRLFFWHRREMETQGLYIWGDVGRGKTMLMDLFFQHLPIEQKRRIHFHAFMQEVHTRLRDIRKDAGGDPLPRLIAEIGENQRVLCLDEFIVEDITDAMLLARLFTGLFEAGVVTFMTSNTPPANLYLHGLQREQFLPFIVLIEQRLEVVKLNALRDYRLAQLLSLQKTYLTPLTPETDAQMDAAFASLTAPATPVAQSLTVNGRLLPIPAAAADVARFTFAELCERPLGTADYLTLAQEFHTLVIDRIPALSPEQRNEAKRFTSLIDALYDHRVKLICSAEAPPSELYPSGNGSDAFQRTASRLIEMQSESYLQAPHHVHSDHPALVAGSGMQ